MFKKGGLNCHVLRYVLKTSFRSLECTAGILHEIRVVVSVKLGRALLGMAEVASDLANRYPTLSHPGSGGMAQGVARAIGYPSPRCCRIETRLHVVHLFAAIGD